MMFKKVMILGANGLIGNNIYRYLASHKINILPCVRNKKKKISTKKNYYYGNLIKNKKLNLNKINLIIKNNNPDLIINCTGITKHKKKVQKNLFLLNYEFIKRLLKFKIKLINFSTDCIFDGKIGNYTESSKQYDNTCYAKSKIQVEKIKSNNLIILRTSSIGSEIETKNGLINWFFSQKKIEGYSNAYFTGPTCLEIAKILFKYIIQKKIISYGLYNIGTKKINKYGLLFLINKKYKKNIKIFKNRNYRIDRSLNINKFLKKTKYRIKLWPKLISEMKNFDEKKSL